MELINAIVAILALVGGFLCARAYLPHISLLGSRPSEYLARGLVLSSLAVGPRSFYWDVMRHMLPDHFPKLHDLLGGISINIGFNVLLVIGIYMILKARYLTIPEEERKNYSIISAVFYPTGLWPRLTKRELD